MSIGFAIVDIEDLEKCKPFKWHFERDYVFCTATKWYLHHVVLNHKPSKMIVVDHINGNRKDCRKSNLRLCTKAQNNYNSAHGKNNTSGFVGVSFYKPTGKWLAQICKDGKHYHLGYYVDIINAVIAYNKKSKDLFGEFAFQNKIPLRKRK